MTKDDHNTEKPGEQWRVEPISGALAGEPRWRLFKNDDNLLDADFLMRPDAQWFADYLNAQSAQLKASQEALIQVDIVRNRIVGYQGVNWSRDVYKLVEALSRAGIVGLDYKVARARAEREIEAAQNNDLEYRDEGWSTLLGDNASNGGT